MSIQAAYDDWSATYDTDKNLTRDLDRIITRKILLDLKCKTVVELGCGTGKNTFFLSQIAEKVYAIDFSKYMIEKAKKKIDSANVNFSIENITKHWSFSDESVDLITCNLILEHIEDLSFIFSEAARVLVKGGYFFLSELHPFKQYGGTKANFKKQQKSVEIKAYVHHISDFYSVAKHYDFTLEHFQQWWHEQDLNKPPRLVSFLLRK